MTQQVERWFELDKGGRKRFLGKVQIWMMSCVCDERYMQKYELKCLTDIMWSISKKLANFIGFAVFASRPSLLFLFGGDRVQNNRGSHPKSAPPKKELRSSREWKWILKDVFWQHLCVNWREVGGEKEDGNGARRRWVSDYDSVSVPLFPLKAI